MDISTRRPRRPVWTRTGPFHRRRPKSRAPEAEHRRIAGHKIGDEALTAPRRALGSFATDRERSSCRSFEDSRQVLVRGAAIGGCGAAGTVSAVQVGCAANRKPTGSGGAWNPGAPAPRPTPGGCTARAHRDHCPPLPLSSLQRSLHRHSARRCPAPAFQRWGNRVDLVLARPRAPEQSSYSRSCRRPRLPGSRRLGHSRSLAQGDRGATAVSDSRPARRQHSSARRAGRDGAHLLRSAGAREGAARRAGVRRCRGARAGRLMEFCGIIAHLGHPPRWSTDEELAA